MKLIAQFLIFILASLLCIPMALAVEWDGKSPKWVGGGGCTEKIKFSVMDKLSTAEKYDVEYRVWTTSEKEAHVLKKHYSDNAYSANAIFPDDFHFDTRNGEFKSSWSLCGVEKIFWSTYVNGKKLVMVSSGTRSITLKSMAN